MTVKKSVEELATHVNGKNEIVKPENTIRGSETTPFDMREELTSKKFGNNSRNQDLHEAVRAVFSNEQLRMKSNLTKRQIAAVLVAVAYDEQFPTTIMKNTIMAALELKVSHLGGGRGDIREILKSVLSMGQIEEKKEQGLRKRMLGF